MTTNLIETDRIGQVCVVRLNRPEKRNPVSTAMLWDLVRIVGELESDDTVRGMLFCGAGKSFCAGRDLKEIQQVHGAGIASATESMAPLRHFFGALEDSNKITISAVQGYAMGFGCVFAAATDLTVAEEGAILAMSEAKRGLGTFGPLPTLLRALPYKIVMEMTLTGEEFSAERAQLVGLVNRVVPEGKAFDSALGWLTEVVARDNGYVRDTKSAMRIARRLTERDAMEYLLDKSALHHAAGSANAGISGFVDRGTP